MICAGKRAHITIGCTLQHQVTDVFQMGVKEFGIFFGSTISWMMGMAMMEGAEEMAIYGVHLSLKKEYGLQRDSFFYLYGIAKQRGIKVIIPEDSGLLANQKLYGNF